MATQIKLRRDTAANWTLNGSVVLAAGEAGFETDTGKLKIGNGTNTWASLDYVIDLSDVHTNIVPRTDNTYDLGSPAKQWRHVYTAGGSIYLDNIKLTNNAGKLEITKVINPGEENEEPDSEDSNAGNSVTEKLTNGEHEFKLESNGTLTLDGDPFTGGGGGSGDRLTNGDYQVVLGSSGNITIPKNKEITLPASTDEDRYGGDISIMGQRGYGNWSTEGNAGFGSSIYIRSGDGGENNVSDQGGEGGEVWIRSGDGQAGNNGGTASLIAGSAKWNNSGSAIYGGNVRITAGNANEDASGFGRGGNVDINAGEGDQSDGSVNINTVGGDFTWTFDPEGVLTIPSSGDIKRSGVSVLGGGATSYAPDDTDNWNEPTINTISAALDELAARVTALQNFEIDGGNANTPALGELLIDGNGA